MLRPFGSPNRRISCILSLLLVVVAARPAFSADDRFDPVRQRIERAIADTNLPSIAVAVAHEGKIVWEEGFGWADRENRVPASEHTLYSLASISKPITATGLMILVERGVIDLDKPIDDYLGEAKLRARVGDAAEATVRRVANHTAGLPLHYQFFYENESYRPPTRDETIRRYANLVSAPGERYQYSNLGFGLLDYVIERAAEQPYADFMRKEVFLPLDMTHTSVDVGPGLEPHQAIRYTPEGKRIPFYEFDHPGASAVYSSAHDLVRFAMFHLKEHLGDQKAILSDAAIDQMQQETVSSPGGGYGIGWGTFKNKRGYDCVQHTGGMPGVSTVCRLVPGERLAVVALANSRSGLPFRLADMITDIMLPEQERSENNGKPESDDEATSDAPFAPSAELIGTWQGELVTHRGDAPLRLVVKDSGDVHVRVGRQLWTLLNDVSFRDGYLRGRFASEIDYEDHRGRDYLVHLELKLSDATLSGPAVTHTQPDAWGSSAVTHWVQLERKQ
ncbi:MAG: class A beta-lactamase-related serine hydrolase [Planctomycetota bacterium]|nr:MAG: class A beta-lactamase-related serine hydrolase [Planctomycetota bacterium]